MTSTAAGVTFAQKGNTMSSSLSRFSVSIPTDLLRQLDAMARAKGYSNRSRALADMVRAQLVEHNAKYGNRQIAGTITLVYDHRKRRLQSALTSAQHSHQDLVISALHVHLDHSNCMEVLALRGSARSIKSFADLLASTKGIKHAKLTLTATGKEFTV